jgi:hypothetical protein
MGHHRPFTPLSSAWARPFCLWKPPINTDTKMPVDGMAAPEAVREPEPAA